MNDGTIEQTADRVTFRYERRLPYPVEAVWTAITDPAEVEAWIGGRVEIDLRPGGPYVIHHRSGERVADRILRVEPPRLLEHTFWVHVNPDALVTWELRTVDRGCELVLTHSMSMDDVSMDDVSMDDVSMDDGRAAAGTVAAGDHYRTILSRNGAGWHRLLDRLDAALRGTTEAWTDQDQHALQARYAAMLT